MSDLHRVDSSIGEVLKRLQSSILSDAEFQARLVANERERARAERRRLLLASGIVHSLTAEDVPRLIDDELVVTPKSPLEIVQAWLREVARARKVGCLPLPRIVILFGKRGLGKTVAAGWAHAREGGLHASFEDLARSHGTRWGPERRLYRRARTIPFLTIDEPDIGVSAEDARAVLHDLVHARQAGQLTLVTGNLSPSDWRARLDARTLARLKPLAFERYVKGTSMRVALRGGGLEAEADEDE